MAQAAHRLGPKDRKNVGGGFSAAAERDSVSLQRLVIPRGLAIRRRPAPNRQKATASRTERSPRRRIPISHLTKALRRSGIDCLRSELRRLAAKRPFLHLATQRISWPALRLGLCGITDMPLTRGIRLKVSPQGTPIDASQQKPPTSLFQGRDGGRRGRPLTRQNSV
jgi:hypothetical protein